jgi:hypothetical protein
MKAFIIAAVIGGCSLFNADGQVGLSLTNTLGQTNIDGLCIYVRQMYRSGDTRDLDCAIFLDVTGEKAASSKNWLPTRLLKAIDDTGKDLLQTKHSRNLKSLPPMRTKFGLWDRIDVKSPAPTAKLIRLLECEFVLPSDTEGKSRTIRFKLENIRLPWISPTE